MFAIAYIASAGLVRAEASDYGHGGHELNSEVSHELSTYPTKDDLLKFKLTPVSFFYSTSKRL